MTNKHFRAILAKNYIAEAIARNPEHPPIAYILSCLEDIEAYTGTGNQPDVKAAYNSAI